ncbi:large ribosomal subunit protein mL49 [Cylas formicarius]|uniref:large ribosomal subunit protein mL49 n=1 Tax=Cylas formicarius TaxID=197179 RepID=UPI0029585D35|nr:large ribosomal subunit protein mL49 [Cylas formicarius]
MVSLFKLTSNLRKLVPQVARLDLLRESSYKASHFLEDIGEIKTQYEVTNDPVDWQYVVNVLPVTVVPEPVKKDFYPSGWKPPHNNLHDRPYMVERTKNHMIPVYLKVTRECIRRHTIVRRIKGDIWLLEKELREFLKDQSPRPLRLQVNEFCGYIRMNGDFVNAIKYFLEQKGY